MTETMNLSLSELGLTSISLLWITLHLMGLLSAWLVRLHDGKHYELFVQTSFFLSLLAVSAATAVGHVCCLEMWPLSALTLSVMIVLPMVDWGTSSAVA